MWRNAGGFPSGEVGKDAAGWRGRLANGAAVRSLCGVQTSPTVLWFRHDLRLCDHAALAAAWARGGAILPVFILDEAGEGAWPAGGASRWWLHHSLAALTAALHARGAQLTLAAGPTEEILAQMVRTTGAGAVYWQRHYEPALAAQEAAVARRLADLGVEARAFPGALLFAPETVRNRQGGPFQVFTPFWRHLQTLSVPAPLELPDAAWPAPERWPASLPLAALQLRPVRAWADGWEHAWSPGEAGAQRQLTRLLANVLATYDTARDLPAVCGTSRLSPHLHFGEISPRQIWAALRARGAERGVFPASADEQTFLRELGWREFAAHLLHHFPHTPTQPLRAGWERFPWAESAAGPGRVGLQAWQRGQTGYPLVDAGMRELWATGWMHNRVRMIVASFLVKHLRISWVHGAAWFWDTLVDADLANNTLGWQWSAGCGADATPYFRIFNPVLQMVKFDPAGAYVRRWVPELAHLPDRHLPAPWEAPAEILASAGVTLGESYPRPVVDHAPARAAALAAYRRFTVQHAGRKP